MAEETVEAVATAGYNSEGDRNYFLRIDGLNVGSVRLNMTRQEASDVIHSLCFVLRYDTTDTNNADLMDWSAVCAALQPVLRRKRRD